jgi:predicted nuclease of predicted toxin-antitoxin system
LRLLFDQNLSYKLVELLSDIYPDSKHVKALDLHKADDLEIWEFSKTKDYIIVSKDSDFHQYSFVYGPPPKVVWISKGNCSTSEIEAILREHKNDLKSFLDNPQASFLEVS